MIILPNIKYVSIMDDTVMNPELESFDALQLVNFYPIPHYTNFPFKKRVKKTIAEYGLILDLRSISNN